MAALVITAANVVYQGGPKLDGQIAGEALVAGAVVYYNTTDGRWYKAKSNGTAAQAGQDGLGMALNTADAAGATVSVARHGATVAVGTGTAGIVYVPSGTTAGSYMPTADGVATNKVQPAALGIGGSKLKVVESYDAGAIL